VYTISILARDLKNLNNMALYTRSDVPTLNDISNKYYLSISNDMEMMLVLVPNFMGHEPRDKQSGMILMGCLNSFALN
jgi:hypothetical protein